MDNGITKVKQLKHLPAEELNGLVNSGIPSPLLLSAVNKCAAAEAGAYSCAMVDHRQHNNPYQSRFPDDYESWLRTCSALKPFICVAELLKWTIIECGRIMQGIKHERDWFFYHDALSLTTSKATSKWM